MKVPMMNKESTSTNFRCTDVLWIHSTYLSEKNPGFN